MRTYARLQALKKWTFDSVCRGKRMKVEPPERDVTKWEEPQEPQVYIAFPPKRFDESQEDELNWLVEQARSVAPAIIIMPTASAAKYLEAQRFDQYRQIHRPQEYGQQLNVQVLFSVYEDGVRLPGFIDKYEETGKFDLSLIREGTQEGLETLLNWIDEFKEKLLGQYLIPDSDMCLIEQSFYYGMRADQRYISDNRPLYYGLCEIGFMCLAEECQNAEISAILD